MPESSNFQSSTCTDLTATVSASGTTTESIDLSGTKLIGIVVPSTFDGTEITLQGSVDNSSFFDVYDAFGTEVAITTSASRLVVFTSNDFIGLPQYIKLVCTSTQTTTDTVFTLITIPL